MFGKKFTILSMTLTIVMLVALFGGMLLAPMPDANAAPAAAITPVSFSGQSGDTAKLTFFNGNITADTRVCFDLSNYSKLDLQYVIDQNTVNTTTLSLQWSNDHNPSTGNGNYEAQATIVSANAADAHGGNQYLTAGQYNCVLADVANSNALGLKVLGVAK